MPPFFLGTSSDGPEMVGAVGKEARSPAALLRLDFGAVPVVFWNSAFWSSMALAASGNMDLMVLGSRPEFRFVPPGEGGGLAPKLQKY